MKVLDLTLPTPAQNLACDEALLDAAELDEGAEILRFWESPEYFVVVGYANCVAKEVKVEECARRRIPILRRCSGGGTVLQGIGCLNYALVLRISAEGPTRNISAANEFILSRNATAVAAAMGVAGDVVAIEGHTDLAMAGIKFSGNSQRRRKNFLLFHGTFLLNFNLHLIGEVLLPPSQQPAYRAQRPHEKFLKNLGVAPSNLKSTIAETWKASETSSQIPEARIEALVRNRYGSQEWSFKN